MFYCGLDSENHAGQLKRICAPIIKFIRWLITLEPNEEVVNPESFDNAYRRRFLCLPEHELRKINFPKHILHEKEVGLKRMKGGFKGMFRYYCNYFNAINDSFLLLQSLE